MFYGGGLWKEDTVCECDTDGKHPEELSYYVHRINRQYEKLRVLELQQYDLTASQFDVLFWSFRRQDRDKLETMQKDIERYFRISNPSVSGIISRLEQKGYVVRTRSEQDRRIWYIRPTEKARGIQKSLWEAHLETEDRLRREYGETAYRDLLAGLNRLLALLTEEIKEESTC